MAKKKKQKYYVVWEGRQTGIFEDWNTCKKLTDNFENAKYKSFDSKSEAEAAFKGNYYQAIIAAKRQEKRQEKRPNPNAAPPIKQAVVVDAAWNSRNKDMEYQGMNFATGERLFLQGPFAGATNNIGEFLAIVHALALLKKHKMDWPVYTDSRTAMSWINRKFANTKLALTGTNGEVFDLIKRAENWLKENKFPNKILKWDTRNWGENPADFGRK